MKKLILAILLTSSFAGLSGCSSAQMYDSLQDAQRDRCYQMMEPDRSQCLRNTTTDYESFKKSQR